MPQTLRPSASRSATAASVLSMTSERRSGTVYGGHGALSSSAEPAMRHIFGRAHCRVAERPELLPAALGAWYDLLAAP